MKTHQSQPTLLNGSEHKIGIILSRYNDSLGDILLENTIQTLQSHQVKESNIEIFRVPGALEIPLTVQMILNKRKDFDALITLGVVIKGDTYHFELVCNETYRKLMDISIEKNKPIIFGVLTVNTVQQAKERVEKDKLNKGKEFAETALEMIQIQKSLQ